MHDPMFSLGPLLAHLGFKVRHGDVNRLRSI